LIAVKKKLFVSADKIAGFADIEVARLYLSVATYGNVARIDQAKIC